MYVCEHVHLYKWTIITYQVLMCIRVRVSFSYPLPYIVHIVMSLHVGCVEPYKENDSVILHVHEHAFV